MTYYQSKGNLFWHFWFRPNSGRCIDLGSSAMLPQQDYNTNVENPMTGMAWAFEEKMVSVLWKFLITTVEMFGLDMG